MLARQGKSIVHQSFLSPVRSNDEDPSDMHPMTEAPSACQVSDTELHVQPYYSQHMHVSIRCTREQISVMIARGHQDYTRKYNANTSKARMGSTKERSRPSLGTKSPRMKLDHLERH